MNRRQIFSIHIVLKCQRSSEAQTFARLQYFCTFVIKIKDRMQYCMEEPKRGCRAWALSIGTRSSYALRAALRAARGGIMMQHFEQPWCDLNVGPIKWGFPLSNRPCGGGRPPSGSRVVAAAGAPGLPLRAYQSGTKPNLLAKILATNFGDHLA